MKKSLKYILTLHLAALFMQPVQAAADESIKVAVGAGAFYAGLFGSLYSSLTNISEENELMLQQNPDKYKVTDESLTTLIQQEAEKKGLDFSKFVVVKNMRPGIAVVAPAGAKKYTFHVGSLSEMDTASQKAVVQHELNHVLYNHTTKQFCVGALSNYIGFLAGYTGLSLATHYTANYIAKNSNENSSIASWIHTLRPFISIGFGFYSGYYLDKKSSPVYSRYCEKQADLAIDDDPTVIKGMITFCQSVHDRKIIQVGQKAVELRQEYVKQHPEKVFTDNLLTDERVRIELAERLVHQHPRLFLGENHPTPLERIAYLRAYPKIK